MTDAQRGNTYMKTGFAHNGVAGVSLLIDGAADGHDLPREERLLGALLLLVLLVACEVGHTTDGTESS